ncbi:uncharacterized protein B0T15DRAFT_543577 [Chaetomium strumarium]|uniref:Rhodopsin domain-containing protein n=1 Tax=Chaetomium strumarium TaxID=1170767 RepID=A0AAJ0GMF2_9PEZI|nr:hypothetical protein B0T15DRAFT_543577 [Chaetomium strumarium]
MADPSKPTAPVIPSPEDIAYNAGPGAIRAISIVMALTTAIVALRIWMRFHRRIGIGLDDWLIIAAWLVLWGEYVVGVKSISDGGIGRHLLVLMIDNPFILSRTMLWMYIGEILFFTCLALIKWSVLAMFYRIFPTRFMKRGYIILGSMTAAWWVAVLLVTIFQCTPVHKRWDLQAKGTCVNDNVFYISTNGVPNIVMDVMILVLPLFEIFKLQVSRAQKIAIACSFLVGWIVVISSIIKLKVMVDLYELGPTADVTYHLPPLIVWVLVEPCMGIISASLPPLRPLLTMFLRRTGLSKESQVSRGSPGRPTLVTFGQSSSRKKNNAGQFTTLMSVNDEDGGSQERLDGAGSEVPGWPQELRSSRSAVIRGGEGREQGQDPLPLQLPHQGGHIPLQSIAVTTEVVWNESHPPHHAPAENRQWQQRYQR